MHANNFFINLTIKLLNLNKKYKLYTITKLTIKITDTEITTYIINKNINCNETNKETTSKIIQNITIKLAKNSVFFIFISPLYKITLYHRYTLKTIYHRYN